MKEIKIIERRAGYSNIMMVELLRLLLGVATKTKTNKVKQGRKMVEVVALKHSVPAHTIESIRASIEHYQNLPDMKQNSFEYRDYQLSIIEKGAQILFEHDFLYLAMEVRTGKTLTSLGICRKIGAKSVLFITKKKAISSIESDYATLTPEFFMETINYESLHKVEHKRWDVIICDEAHSLGAFPKPSNRAKDVCDLIAEHRPRVILLSGTPTPESYSQMYHQVYGIPGNPFSSFKSFYRFADAYIDVKTKMINSVMIKDYSRGKDEIIKAMEPYTINYSQKQAGFVVETKEHVLRVKMKDSTCAMIAKLKKDLVLQGKDEVILADTPVKLMQKLHQMYSGTVKFESGKSMTFDLSKAEFIKNHFAGKKIGIFYKFKEELSALTQVFGEELTTDLSLFSETEKSIALQIVSGREGISLRQADALVYFNIDFSATSYWQSRDRMTTKDRLESDIYWIFSEDGIEDEIYKAVSKKKDYTISHFKKQFLKSES